MGWWTEKAGSKSRGGRGSWFDMDTSGSPCRPGRSHRWTVMSSHRDYVNCWHCGASKRR